MEEIVTEIESLRNEISELRQLVAPKQEWYDLREVAELKGIPYGTLTARPWIKPNGGVPDGIIGGRAKWRNETVRKWLDQTDEDLPQRDEAQAIGAVESTIRSNVQEAIAEDIGNDRSRCSRESPNGEKEAKNNIKPRRKS